MEPENYKVLSKLADDYMNESFKLHRRVLELEDEFEKLKFQYERKCDRIDELESIISEFEKACYDKACNDEPLYPVADTVRINSLNQPTLMYILRNEYYKHHKQNSSIKEEGKWNQEP